MAHGPFESADEFVSNYEAITVPDVRQSVRSLSVSNLQAILDHEQDRDGRTTAVEAIEEALDAQVGSDDDGDEAAAGDGDDADSESVPVEPSADGGRRLRVRNHETNARQVRGHTFDAGEIKELRDTPAIRSAIEYGLLQFVAEIKPPHEIGVEDAE